MSLFLWFPVNVFILQRPYSSPRSVYLDTIKDTAKLEAIRTDIVAQGVAFLAAEMAAPVVNERYLTTVEILKQCAATGTQFLETLMFIWNSELRYVHMKLRNPKLLRNIIRNLDYILRRLNTNPFLKISSDSKIFNLHSDSYIWKPETPSPYIA